MGVGVGGGIITQPGALLDACYGGIISRQVLLVYRLL
jgi:hypothetical protein